MLNHVTTSFLARNDIADIGEALEIREDTLAASTRAMLLDLEDVLTRGVERDELTVVPGDGLAHSSLQDSDWQVVSAKGRRNPVV